MHEVKYLTTGDSVRKTDSSALRRGVSSICLRTSHRLYWKMCSICLEIHGNLSPVPCVVHLLSEYKHTQNTKGRWDLFSIHTWDVFSIHTTAVALDIYERVYLQEN